MPLIRCLGGLYQARPRNVVLDRVPLDRRKVFRNRIVREQVEDGFFRAQFGAETVHHAYGAIFVGAHERVRKIEPHQKFLKLDAAVDQVDCEFASSQYAVSILELLRRNNLAREALAREKRR